MMRRPRLDPIQPGHGHIGLAVDDRGSLAVESAALFTVLTLLMAGVVDFGLAHVRQMEIANAARAGIQFALARHPTTPELLGDLPESVTTIDTIRSRVIASATFLSGDPGEDLQVCVTYRCPDGSESTCSPNPGAASCANSETYLTIVFNSTYDPLLPYPGLPQSFWLGTTATVRLN
jgi:hypothetical protein